MTNKRFSKEEIEKAGSADLVSLLENKGETLKREGKSYAWSDNGQKVSITGNRWFHQYERVGGNAIDFVKRYFNKSFIEAVDFLLDGRGGELILSQAKPRVKIPFKLPPKDNDNIAMRNYLEAVRGIYPEVIDDFEDVGLIYQSSNKGYKNVVFVGIDENAIPKHACMRGINGNFKGNPSSSDEEYSFHWNGTSDEVYLFEAPIDMLSFICMNDNEWQEHTYIAACCVGDRPLMKCLQNNPNIRKIHLCFDNDEAGQNAVKRILDKFKFNDYYKCDVLIPECKDWNEDLITLEEGEDVEWTSTMQ